MKLIVRIKGGPGSGNWAHIGRAGVVGGSAPRDSGMSIASGSTWLERYERVKGKPHPYAAELKKDPTTSEKIPINTKTAEIVLEYIRDRYLPEEIDAAMAAAESLVKDEPVSMRVPSEILIDYILPQGKFKNQHETGTSGGYLDSEYRKSAERTAFGEDLEEFPIYGYIKTENDYVDMYGDARVVLKPSVRERTTITMDDSLENFTYKQVAPSPLTKLRPQCIDNAYEPETGKFLMSYIEAQIHGGLTLADIDYVDLFRCKLADVGRIAAALDQYGIKYIGGTSNENTSKD